LRIGPALRSSPALNSASIHTRSRIGPWLAVIGSIGSTVAPVLVAISVRNPGGVYIGAVCAPVVVHDSPVGILCISRNGPGGFDITAGTLGRAGVAVPDSCRLGGTESRR